MAPSKRRLVQKKLRKLSPKEWLHCLQFVALIIFTMFGSSHEAWIEHTKTAQRRSNIENFIFHLSKCFTLTLPKLLNVDETQSATCICTKEEQRIVNIQNARASSWVAWPSGLMKSTPPETKLAQFYKFSYRFAYRRFSIPCPCLTNAICTLPFTDRFVGLLYCNDTFTHFHICTFAHSHTTM